MQLLTTTLNEHDSEFDREALLSTYVVIDMVSSAVAAANAEMRGCTREDIYNCTLRCIKASNRDLAWRFVAVCYISILVVGSTEGSYKSRVVNKVAQ